MNDAVLQLSPVQSSKTVGNSQESSQKIRQVQILEKDDTFALDAMWVAFLRTTSSETKTSFKTPHNPQGTPQDLSLESAIPNTESGEGVVSSDDVVQVP